MQILSGLRTWNYYFFKSQTEKHHTNVKKYGLWRSSHLSFLSPVVTCKLSALLQHLIFPSLSILLRIFPFISAIQCLRPNCHYVVSELPKQLLFSSFFGFFLLIHLAFFPSSSGMIFKGIFVS